MKGFVFTFILVFLTLNSGCSTAGNSLKVDYSGIASLSDTANLQVAVICKAPKAEKEKSKIEDSVIARIKKMGIFNNVYTVQAIPETDLDLRLEITVTAFKPVSKSARFWIGAMAGKGKIEATIDIYNLVSNRKIARASVSGSTSSGSALAGTTQEAIDKLADAIVGIFKEKFEQNKI